MYSIIMIIIQKVCCIYFLKKRMTHFKMLHENAIGRKNIIRFNVLYIIPLNTMENGLLYERPKFSNYGMDNIITRFISCSCQTFFFFKCHSVVLPLQLKFRLNKYLPHECENWIMRKKSRSIWTCGNMDLEKSWNNELNSRRFLKSQNMNKTVETRSVYQIRHNEFVLNTFDSTRFGTSGRGRPRNKFFWECSSVHIKLSHWKSTDD